MTLAIGQVAHLAQADLQALEKAFPSDPRVQRLHDVLANLARRSAAGQNLTAADLFALGLPVGPVPDDGGTGKPTS